MSSKIVQSRDKELVLNLSNKLSLDGDRFYTKERDSVGFCYKLRAPIGKEWVKHSNFSNHGIPIIIHTESPEDVKKMVDHARKLFDEALLENEKQKVMEKAGLIFWWLCQAKPWVRGDPSIAELLIKTLLRKKDIPIRPWTVGIIPWVQVMLELDPVAFSRKFHTLFEEAAKNE
jgi:Avirulence protein